MTSSPGPAPPAAELVILVGLPGSGKSTFVRERFGDRHVHVSRDVLRSERRQRDAAVAALRAGRSVVVDNVHARAVDRAPWIALGRAHGARVVGYFVEATAAEARARNRRRAGRARVPDVAIYVSAKRLTPPAYEEGFDALYRVRTGTDGCVVTPIPGRAATS
ncbi:MAG: AAA family ATPase [Candidatus Rokuibacteriota bacterium]